MRLLHPDTIQIVAKDLPDSAFKNSTVSRKQVISHAWSECLKWLATKQQHPKMFLTEQQLGWYLSIVKENGNIVECNLNEQLLIKYDSVWIGYVDPDVTYLKRLHFDDSYLFSDAVSLYLKGLNIFPNIFGEEWRKYVPIENLKEIKRIVDKTLDK